ncbi:hypothetical protein [Mucilaginibacter terrae]|uniref:Uncharacterized protein n=1 Tax=Mucilaginibacter terrae TaxID=1955052 RepID=A0ABU3GP75_9SPHI|nr:hypothetical protein [Mucilaginibacter terrae]MDT3401321.1 hypothetical protein [Mucilaginibacter terrae]
MTFTTEISGKENDIIAEPGRIVLWNEENAISSSYCDVWKFKDGLIEQVTSLVIKRYATIGRTATYCHFYVIKRSKTQIILKR